MLYAVAKKSSFYFGGNNCQFLSNDFKMNRTRRILLIFEWPVCPWGRAADGSRWRN